MIWRVILLWLLGASFALAGLPRHAMAFPSSGAQNLITGVSLPNGTSIANSYDGLARLTSTALLNPWGHILDGYAYALDSLGLRKSITNELGVATNIVSVGYDPIGQLTSWSGTEAGGALRHNEQLGYAYDAAGNLHLRTNDALIQTFNTDSANQLVSVTRTGPLTVIGATPVPAVVTVNGSVAQTNGDLTFAATNIPLANGSNTFTEIAQNIHGASATNILAVNLPTPRDVPIRRERQPDQRRHAQLLL